MCLIAFAWKAHPDFPLVVGANRDEFFERPALPAGFWPERGDLLAGRDLRKGGTWLGVTRSGRFAAVTNYRQGGAKGMAPRSRGELVANFLMSDQTPAAYVASAAAARDAFDGFNLLVGDMHDLFHYSNRNGDPQRVTSGVHGLSNALVDTPWPKVQRARAALATLLGTDSPDRDALIAGMFALLADQHRPPDHELPATGVGLEWERLLSSAFIVSPDYGTRSSTVLLVGRQGAVTFVERSFDDRTGGARERTYEFALSPHPVSAS